MAHNYHSSVKNKLDQIRSIIKSESIKFDIISSEMTIIKGKLIFINGSILEFHELVSDKEHDYRFHWMDKESKLVSRWDNAPHHKKLDNFPYHLHLPDRIESSLEINLIQVLDVIKMSIIGMTGEDY